MITVRPSRLFSKAAAQLPSREAWAWENDEKTWATCVSREPRSSKLLSRLAAVAPHEPQSSQTPPRKETKATKEAKVTQETASNSGQLKWEALVQSAVLELKLHVNLSAGCQKSRVAESFGHSAIPRCAIHVWVEGLDGTHLAEARASVCPKNTRSAVHVHWICRTKSCRQCPDDQWRLIKEHPCPPAAKRPWTIPQALLSIVAKIGESFGMARVELGAEDQGSKKLIQYYSDLGFRGNSDRTLFGELSMDAPIASVSAFAPESWIAKLPLAQFNAWSWLWGSMKRPSLGSILNLMAAPDTWHWPIEWPLCSEIQIKMSWLSDAANSKATITARLRKGQAELAYCRAVCRLKQRSVRVLWIGNSGSKPAHSVVRGRLLDGTHRSTSGQVTVAVALLGSVAAMARWLGTELLELTATDNGSGKLMNYLLSLGFKETGAPGSDSVSTSCEEFANMYCPKAWREQLPPDSNLSMLAMLCDS